MVPWWTLIIAIFVGSFIGVILLALVSANDPFREE